MKQEGASKKERCNLFSFSVSVEWLKVCKIKAKKKCFEIITMFNAPHFSCGRVLAGPAFAVDFIFLHHKSKSCYPSLNFGDVSFERGLIGVVILECVWIF